MQCLLSVAVSHKQISNFRNKIYVILFTLSDKLCTYKLKFLTEAFSVDSFRWDSSSSFPYAFSSDLKFVHDGNTFLIILLTCKKEVSLKSIQKIKLVNVYRIFVNLNKKIYPWWKSLIGQLAKSHDFQMKLLLNVMAYSMSWKKSHDFIWSFSCTILSDDFTHSSTKMFWLFVCLEQDGLTGWQRSNRRVFPDLFGRIKLCFYPSFHGFSETLIHFVTLSMSIYLSLSSLMPNM